MPLADVLNRAVVSVMPQTPPAHYPDSRYRLGSPFILHGCLSHASPATGSPIDAVRLGAGEASVTEVRFQHRTAAVARRRRITINVS